ncbi:prolyl oligopeptidase family serine peptidase [Jeotgalicoccus sp. ATCC 8456]|uniref:prolyl oligopeptidase family serine peptidase n=1 Tax=Jeotgalicoccus sp. ATCC 8456 TaxID=946435 RepID=UPI0018E63AF7|nr:prolyl oligopeptidase family serine peptidase [Jeotgalicoccus sp. ATCC 8456]QQD85660.1 prolyl oligopeptidase family serine peptidase [Jeotgalicoccus sp. ATCC 8456]
MNHTIDNLNEIDNLKLEAGVGNNITYRTDFFEYNVLVYVKERFDNLVVLSNGAVNYEKKAPPIFMRSKWARDIDGNLIYLDDPTIHNTQLNLGWGQGNSKEFALRVYSEMVKKISKLLKIEDTKICYYGSSAGGFMSMVLASMHTDSFSIVNNPQTDVRSYHEGHSYPLLELSYGNIDQAYKDFPERVNVAEAFKYTNYVPKVYYIQNQFSHHDLKFHVNPFIKSMKEYELDLEKIIFINYFDKEKGHTPLDKDPAVNSINLLLSRDIF